MVVDPKCYELAEHFLPESLQSKQMHLELAEHIQESIEAWFFVEEQRIKEYTETQTTKDDEK